MENRRKHIPEWYTFKVNNFNMEGECISEEWKPFWNRVIELRKSGVTCKCGNNEVEPFGRCTKCWLENPSYEFRWEFGKKESFLCISKELIESIDIEFYAYHMAITQADLWEVFRRHFYNIQKGKCGECNANKEINEMELHHKIPVSNGGRETSDNLIMLCKPCHYKHIQEAIYGK